MGMFATLFMCFAVRADEFNEAVMQWQHPILPNLLFNKNLNSLHNTLIKVLITSKKIFSHSVGVGKDEKMWSKEKNHFNAYRFFLFSTQTHSRKAFFFSSFSSQRGWVNFVYLQSTFLSNSSQIIIYSLTRCIFELYTQNDIY